MLSRSARPVLFLWLRVEWCAAILAVSSLVVFLPAVEGLLLGPPNGLAVALLGAAGGALCVARLSPRAMRLGAEAFR